MPVLNAAKVPEGWIKYANIPMARIIKTENIIRKFLKYASCDSVFMDYLLRCCPESVNKSTGFDRGNAIFV
jgi:hypothetical protein